MSDSEVDLLVEGDQVQPTQENKKKKKKKKKKKSGNNAADATTDTTTDAPAQVKPPARDVGAFLASISQDVEEAMKGLPSDLAVNIPSLSNRKLKANLPIGKNTTQLPEEYSNINASKANEAPRDGSDISGATSRTFVTVPILPQNPSLKVNPDGWCEVVLADPGLEKVIYAASKNFPHPIDHPPKPRQCLKASPTSGIGMFATTDLGLNDLILGERPLLITPNALPDRIVVPKDVKFTAEQLVLLQIQEEEKVLRCAVERMSPEAREAYTSLANSHLEDGSGPLLGVSRTNGFGMSFEEGGERHSAVYDKISRINHSCLPNAAVKFNKKSFAGELRAIRPIKAGEEIYVCYCGPQDARVERQKDLQKYGFTCSCELCSSSDLEDFRRRMVFSLRKITPLLVPGRPDGMSRGELDSTAKECVRWIKQIEARGFQGSNAYLKYLQVAVTCYSRLDNQREAVEWAAVWGRIEHALSGPPGFLKLLTILAVMAPSTMKILQSRWPQ